MKFIDLTGKKFGRLTVLKVYGKDKHNKIIWNCLCECGKETNVLANGIKSGRTKSCGCLKIETTIIRSTIHGFARRKNRSLEYSRWASMIKRCTNQKAKSFKDYGGRGIVVCERWLHSFQNFHSDMGESPSQNHSIDRINNDGNYEPSNCRWSTQSEQVRNQGLRTDNISGYKGIKWENKYSKWRSRIRVNGKEIYLGIFDNLNDAVESRKEAEFKYWGKSS